MIPLVATAGNIALRWVLPVVASYAADLGVRKLFEDEDSSGANAAGTTASVGTFLGSQSFGKNPNRTELSYDINTKQPNAWSGNKYAFKKPSKASMILSSIPVALSLIGMFKSDDPSKQQEVVNAITTANPDADQQKIINDLAKLNSATSQAKKEYQSVLQMGNLIDPTGPVDLNRVQSIVNEAKRAKEKYDLMDTMGAIYVMAGVQGGLDMIEKGKLLSSETASKIAKLNADKESASKGDKDAMGSLRKGLDDLDAIMGHNNSVISAFSAKHQADYQNKSLENQKMETLFRISSGGKSTKELDPTKNAGALGTRIGGMQVEYYKMLKDNDGQETPQSKELKSRIDSLQSVFDKMYGVKSSGARRSISI